MLKTDTYMLCRDSVVLSLLSLKWFWLPVAFCCSKVKPDGSWFRETLFGVQATSNVGWKKKIEKKTKFETNSNFHLDCIVASQILSNHWNWSHGQCHSICISVRPRRVSLSIFWPNTFFVSSLRFLLNWFFTSLLSSSSKKNELKG